MKLFKHLEGLGLENCSEWCIDTGDKKKHYWFFYYACNSVFEAYMQVTVIRHWC